MSERTLIDWIRAAGMSELSPEIALGPGDDCALINLADGTCLAFAADALIEGVHFDLSACTPQQAGRKALCVNLSDIAAMGYEPLAATATVCLVRSGDDDLARGLCEGLWSAAKQFGCPVVGGDIASAPDGRITISVAILGRGPANAFRRSGARPGDALLVTGELGGSIRGRHLDFTPRLAESRRLRELGGVSAMIDISDGLSTDLGHILEESRVGAEIRAESIPISADARALAAVDPSRGALDRALHDGEDFELLLAAPPHAADKILEGWDSDTPLRRIGEITDAAGEAVLVRADGRRERLAPRGYEHET